jgi:cytochrome P450
VETLRSLLLKHSPLRYKPLAALLHSALRHRVMIAADGDDWLRTHEAINPEFLTGLVAAQYVPVIQSAAEDAFAGLARLPPSADAAPAWLEIEVEPLMRVVTSRVLGHVLFGEALATEEARWLEKTLSAVTQVHRGVPARINQGVGAVLRAAGLAGYQRFLLPREQRLAVAELVDWIGAKIDQADLSATLPPLLESLKRRYADQPLARRRRSIAAEYAMLFIAGIETTASALTFAIAQIASNPPVRDEVVREARYPREHTPGGQPLARQYPYLHCVFRETLRRHTIVPTLLRETEKDYELSGTKPGGGTTAAHCVRKGATLRYLSVQGHMRRDVWREPNRFDPARFARPLAPEQSRSYIPFGFGPQRCPGHAMATAEAILILGAFFRRFDIESAPVAASLRKERNILFTVRPVGVTVRVRSAQTAGLPDAPSLEPLA